MPEFGEKHDKQQTPAQVIIVVRAVRFVIGFPLTVPWT